MADIAVLTHNYKTHLDPALKNGGVVTFYSNIAWRSIEDAHIAGEKVTIYFIVAEQLGEITYEATLEKIVILPFKDTALLENLLIEAPDEAAQAEVEKGSARTIYSVTGVKIVSPPFSQTELIKQSDHKPVSKDYARSYCIVSPHERRL